MITGLNNGLALNFYWATSRYLNQWWISSKTHIFRGRWVNTLRLRQNGCHFADAIFKCIFLNENLWILLEISLKFIPKFPINNITALVQIMAWCQPGNKPLSEPMMLSLLTHICITLPLWVKGFFRISMEMMYGAVQNQFQFEFEHPVPFD